MRDYEILRDLNCINLVFKEGSFTQQTIKSAIDRIVGLKAENEALRNRLELFGEKVCRNETYDG